MLLENTFNDDVRFRQPETDKFTIQMRKHPLKELLINPMFLQELSISFIKQQDKNTAQKESIVFEQYDACARLVK